MAGAPARTLQETRFTAMGSDVDVLLVGASPSLLGLAEARVRELESRWSRFLATSEVSALNGHAGHPLIVSAETVDLVVRAVRAWHLTGGLFDPTVGAALAAHGYDEDFAAVAARRARPAPGSAIACPGAAEIVVDPGICAVTLPAGVSLDLGGIGKGLAADLTADLLLDQGATGALVSVGGDLRAVGSAPSDEGWVVSVPDPLSPGAELLRLALPEGAVATSSRLRRRWRTTNGAAHHLIDPRTGRPADTDVVAVTVVAAAAWRAEVLSKALFLGGPPMLSQLDDAHGVIVTADGARHSSPGIGATLR